MWGWGAVSTAGQSRWGEDNDVLSDGLGAPGEEGGRDDSFQEKAPPGSPCKCTQSTGTAGRRREAAQDFPVVFVGSIAPAGLWTEGPRSHHTKTQSRPWACEGLHGSAGWEGEEAGQRNV